MKPNEAYDIIVRFLSERNHDVIFHQEYNPEAFGNFMIGFKLYDSIKSITCDRGELFFCNSPDGNSNCIMVTSSIYETSENDLMSLLHGIK